MKNYIYLLFLSTFYMGCVGPQNSLSSSNKTNNGMLIMSYGDEIDQNGKTLMDKVERGCPVKSSYQDNNLMPKPEVIIPSIFMRVEPMDDTGIDKSDVYDANQQLENHIVPEFNEFLRGIDSYYLNKLSRDTIEFVFLISELKLEYILIQIKTDSLLLTQVTTLEGRSYQDSKGIRMAKLFKSNLAANVWKYPRLITTKKVTDNFAIKYFLRNKKEIIFEYIDYDSDNFTPDLRLERVSYLELTDHPKDKPKKKKKVIPKRNFIYADFINSAQGFYKFDSDFMKYLLPEAAITNLYGN